MSARLETIDALRGISSLAVCWYHMTNTYTPDSWVRASGRMGHFGVDVFFVISGFIIPYMLCRNHYQVRHHWGVFLKKRILRIDPPYIAAAALAALLWYLSSLTPGFAGQALDLSWQQVLYHLGYLNSIMEQPWLNPVFWTLAIEFQYYLLISILFPLLIRPDMLQRLASLILLGSTVFVVESNVFVFHHIGLFLTGILSFQYFSRVIQLPEFILGLGLSAALLSHTHSIAVAMVGISTALLICFVSLPRYRLLSFLGLISYSLYLLHVPIGGRVVNLGRRIATSEFEFLLISVTGAALSILMAYGFYRLIEKPFQAWSTRIQYKHTS